MIATQKQFLKEWEFDVLDLKEDLGLFVVLWSDTQTST